MDAAIPGLIAPLRAAPHRAAVLLDIDGTLAPIVSRPEDAAVPPETLAALRALVGRYAVVGCVTGRPALTAREMVPVDGVEIAGNHGLELLRDGRVELAPDAAPFADAVREAVAWLAADEGLRRLGCEVEDKGITLTVHFRNAGDRDAARAELEGRTLPALRERGLDARFGRMVLEARPPVAVDKGSAVRRLCEGRDARERLFVGDDRTDIDAFREVTVRIAVRAAEAPPEVADAADACLDSTGEVAELLALLA